MTGSKVLELMTAAALTTVLAACGGGGGGGGDAAIPAPVQLAGVNDTGVGADRCFAAGTDALVACNSAEARALSTAQDGMLGRDADASTNSSADGRLGFRFTAIGGGCVRDEVTGLVWERKTSDGGPRDQSRRYTNFGDRRSGDASEFVATVNEGLLCGSGDWRLPTAAEMRSLIDFGVRTALATSSDLTRIDPGPPWIDQTWFPDVQARYWTADGRIRPYSEQTGIDRGYNYPENQESVRLVRGGYAQLAQNRFQPSADGQEVTDLQTSLIWKRCPEGTSFAAGACTGVPLQLTHEQALQRGAAQAAAAGKAWRLPNAKEQMSLPRTPVAGSGALPGVAAGVGYDPLAFPMLPSAMGVDASYWSSTPSWGAATNVYPSVYAVVAFPGSEWRDEPRGKSLMLRLVRTAP
jgi:hypothetical protein